jgi:hypothetical protein
MPRAPLEVTVRGQKETLTEAPLLMAAEDDPSLSVHSPRPAAPGWVLLDRQALWHLATRTFAKVYERADGSLIIAAARLHARFRPSRHLRAMLARRTFQVLTEREDDERKLLLVLAPATAGLIDSLRLSYDVRMLPGCLGAEPVWVDVVASPG